MQATAKQLERDGGGSSPSCEDALPLQVSAPTKATYVVDDSGGGGGSEAVGAATSIDTDAGETQACRTAPPAGDGARRNDHGVRANEVRAIDSHAKSDTAARHEPGIGYGCQSSAERNIWSVFNPIWSAFVVDKARLPAASDKEADWSGTVGRPDKIKDFLGLKNPINRK